jgi:hypothetical protein
MKVNKPGIISYINRYDDEFKFTINSPKEILWEGKFEHCRFSFPNDYTKAYKKYKDEGGKMNLEEFKEEVHEYDDELREYKMGMDLVKLIEPRRDIISMVDPSGGPYISRGMDMGYIDEKFKGRKVDRFEPIPTGYKIIIK